jgi:hypothetical protein
VASDYEQRARERKAAMLTSHFRVRGISSADLEAVHPDVRQHHAKLAGVRNPSDETWSMMLKTVDYLEKNPGPEDPFEGL